MRTTTEATPTWRTKCMNVLDVVASAFKGLVLPNSLSRQMATAAVMIAVGAIVATAFLSSFAVSNAFSTYLYSSLEQQTSDYAQKIGQIYLTSGPNANFSIATLRALAINVLTVDENRPNGTGPAQNVWVMGSDGTLIVPFHPALQNVPESNTIVPALQSAIDSKHPVQGDLDKPHSWFNYSARAFAVAPVIVTIDNQQQVLGSVGLTSSVSFGPGFINTVNHVLLLGGLIIAALVAVGGALLARRITQPLDTLASAADKMAEGDLTARVDLVADDTPAEVAHLAGAFNAMAAALERDVNELKRQEQLQRELVANVAHELATPLTAIQGFSEALVDDMFRNESERKEITRIINRETVRLQSLVDQLRQVARLEAGTEIMEMLPVNFSILVNETFAFLHGESEKHHVTMHNTIPNDLPDVLVDANRLTQVLLNLLDNALRHTPEDGTITVSAQRVSEMIEVRVTDSGSGISPEDLPRIFDRFYRADPSRNRLTGGSGLGLAIVRGVIEAHGGQIRAVSTPDAGTTIIFTLRPVAEAPIPAQSVNTIKRVTATSGTHSVSSTR